MRKYLIPLGIFLALVVMLGVGLTLNPREVPSPLIGKPAPQFKLAQLHEPGKTLGPADLTGKVWVLNVWASWCVSCREEHATLTDFAKSGMAPVYGLNYKDDRKDALRWLQQFGNPYTASVFDPDGRVGLDYGVYGVPETYVIDKQGVIRFKQIGPVTPDVIARKMRPLIEELNRG
jgi:cytochrome c biogenesis protein CcmG/thiol:disulfide interchange protein DsbE